MLNYPPLEKLLPKAENRYVLAMLAKGPDRLWMELIRW